MKKFILPLAIPVLFPAAASAEALNVCDFENYEIGQELTLWNRYGAETTSTAKVVADPSNPLNKVLFVDLKDWNDYVELQLPEEFAGKNLTDNFTNIKFDFCRAGGENYKQMHVMLGSDMIYGDENYVDQGAEGQWSKRSYELKDAPAENTSDMLHVGLNSSSTSYYIDNIVLTGSFDDYVIYENGVLDFCDRSSTSSSYTRFGTPINIPANTELKVYTSRYAYWTSNIIGSGTLNIYSGGERMYLGTEKGNTHPDWSQFDGDVHIYPFNEIQAGSYGVMLCHGGKKFTPEDIRTAISGGDYTSILMNNDVTLHDGATLSVEVNGTARAFRIGKLATEKGSNLSGHYKDKTGYRSYYIVGYSNSDSELAGKISPVGNSQVGVIKEGSGTYRITGNENNITGTLSVMSGKVLIENDAEAAKRDKLPGAVGTSSNSSVAVAVFNGGLLGGTGNIAGLTDVYGIVEPGTDVPGTLTLADYVKSTPVDLRLRPTGRLRFKINSAESYDRLAVTGNVCYDNRGEDLQPSDKTPILEIKLPFKHSLKVGDKFTLLTAAGRTAVNEADAAWTYRIQYPKAYTWKVEEVKSDNGYSIVAEVTSLEYSGQGDTIYDDGESGDKTDNSDYLVDYNYDFSDTTPMREYATRAGKGLGVAVPVWRGYLDQPDKASLISTNFNMVVAENCMKFDAIHPSRDSYSFGGPDGLVDFAIKNDMAVRGHTLVWHKQVPGWLTSDGKINSHKYTRDELLTIMKEHIDKVAGRYKKKIREWDVVNECLDDDQSIVWTDPKSFKLRQSVWQLGIGSDFIEKAFEYAHQADPDAELYLNDYGVEFMGQPKAEAFYNLAKSLVEKGVPIHGVGLQCHITVGELKADKLVANIRRFEEIGLKCIITELDIAQDNPGSEGADVRQAIEYCETVNAALSEPNCPTVMIWGIKDDDSWRKGNPLLWDSSMNPKESFYSVHGALRHLAGQASITSPVEDEADIVAEEYYNVQGMRIGRPANGIFIRKTVYSDGSAKTEKMLVR